MTMFEEHPVLSKVSAVVATGLLAWGGTNITLNNKTNAVQDEQIQNLEALSEVIHEMSLDVSDIRVDVAIVKERTAPLPQE